MMTRREFLKKQGWFISLLFLFGLYSPDKNEKKDFIPSDKEADFYEKLAG